MEVSWGEFLNLDPEERRAFMREVLAEWQHAYRHKCQLDAEADQRAADRGTIDAPGPIDEVGLYAKSGTTRSPG